MDNNVLKALNVIEQVNNVILGKDKQIREIMAAFLVGGHILLKIFRVLVRQHLRQHFQGNGT